MPGTRSCSAGPGPDATTPAGWPAGTGSWHLPGMHPGLHAQTQPDQAANIMPSRGVPITYRQRDEGSNRAAHLFRSLGLRQGDGIAMLLENHPRFYEIAWGAQRSGLYYTPMSTRLTPGEAE